MGGAIAILLLAALVVFAFKAGSLLALTFRTVAPAIVERLSDEVGEEERSRLLSAFEAAAKQAETGELDPERLLAVQRQFGNLASGGEIDSEAAAALSRDLEALAGVEPAPASQPSATPEPVPAPETEPPPPSEEIPPFTSAVDAAA